MRNSVEDVFNSARALLGETGGPIVFTDSVLQQYFNLAYPEMWQIMAMIQTPRVKRELYWIVPAYTTQFDPQSVGATDFAEPELMWERGNLTSVVIATTSNATPIAVATSAPHNLASSADVTVSGVAGTSAPWGRWFVTVTGPSGLTLNGSVTDGSAGTGGALVSSPEWFDNNPVACIAYPTDSQQLRSRLGTFMWEQNVLKFRGATAAAQIRLTYWASGSPPSSTATVLGIDDCMSYLATRTASLAAQGKGWDNMADRWELKALGPKRMADGSGGLLRDFLVSQVKGLQRTSHRRRPFSPGVDGGANQQWIYGSHSQQ